MVNHVLFCAFPYVFDSNQCRLRCVCLCGCICGTASGRVCFGRCVGARGCPYERLLGALSVLEWVHTGVFCYTVSLRTCVWHCPCTGVFGTVRICAECIQMVACLVMSVLQCVCTGIRLALTARWACTNACVRRLGVCVCACVRVLALYVWVCLWACFMFRHHVCTVVFDIVSVLECSDVFVTVSVLEYICTGVCLCLC